MKKLKNSNRSGPEGIRTLDLCRFLDQCCKGNVLTKLNYRPIQTASHLGLICFIIAVADVPPSRGVALIDDYVWSACGLVIAKPRLNTRHLSYLQSCLLRCYAAVGAYS